MKARSLLPTALFLATLAASCAVNDGSGPYGSSAYAPPPPSPSSQVALMGLPPEYRPFVDALADQGDWVLIEPYGYCFRPRVTFTSWRPYQEGYWEPSDYYGWIWNSTEDFGWITYHYGSWFYDDFQGWVWQPGLMWGPAWVAWAAADDYVGWAPLAPSGYTSYDKVPGGVFTYSKATAFTSRDVGTQALYVTHLPNNVSSVRPIINIGRADGAIFNKGPDIYTLQAMGTLVTDRADVSQLQRIKTTKLPQASEAELQARTSRLQAEAVRELSALRQQGLAPPLVPTSPQAPVPPSPVFKPGTPSYTPHDTTHAHKKPKAPADSTRAKKKLRQAPAGQPQHADSTLTR